MINQQQIRNREFQNSREFLSRCKAVGFDFSAINMSPIFGDSPKQLYFAARLRWARDVGSMDYLIEALTKELDKMAIRENWQMRHRSKTRHVAELVCIEQLHKERFTNAAQKAAFLKVSLKSFSQVWMKRYYAAASMLEGWSLKACSIIYQKAAF